METCRGAAFAAGPAGRGLRAADANACLSFGDPSLSRLRAYLLDFCDAAAAPRAPHTPIPPCPRASPALSGVPAHIAAIALVRRPVSTSARQHAASGSVTLKRMPLCPWL